MDGKRFDELTRVMGAGASRRRVIKGLAAGAGGSLVALVGRRAHGVFAASVGATCASDSDCDAGLSCITNRCQECGPYTPEQTVFCPSGQYCDVSGTNGTCVDCNCADNEVCAPINYTPEDHEVTTLCTCPNETCAGVCCAAGQVCNIAGACADPGTLHNPCATGDVCNAGLYCIQGNCDVCSQTPDNPCPGGLYCDVSGYWAACVDLCEVNSVTCGDNETCNPGTGNCDCKVDLCQGTCCAVGENCADSGCKAPSALGGVCADNDPCAQGLSCINGRCQECGPYTPEQTVFCPTGQYCDVSGANGVCKDCGCSENEVCGPINYTPNNQPVDVCTCPNVTCGDACCDAGMVCNGTACVECNGDNDCVAGEICTNNVCVGVQCTSDSMCDAEAGQVCDETDHTCKCAHETCGAGTAKVCCADGEVCNADGGCSTACKKNSDCGKGEHCDAKAGYCVADECAKDTDCPGTKVCASGICVAQCANDSDCASGDVCTDGSCVAGESDNGGGQATQLPSTGVGRGKSGGSSWLGAAVIGGAAALLAGKKLRQDATTTDAE